MLICPDGCRNIKTRVGFGVLRFEVSLKFAAYLAESSDKSARLHVDCCNEPLGSRLIGRLVEQKINEGAV